MIQILLVLPSDAVAARLGGMLDAAAMEYTLQRQGDDEGLLERLRPGAFDIAIIAGRIGDRAGIEVIAETESQRIGTPIILLLDRTDTEAHPDAAMQAIALGAADSLMLAELTPASLRHAIGGAIARSSRLEALHLSREQYRSAWEYSTDAIAILTSDGRIHAVNPAFHSIFQYSPADVVGRHFDLFFSQEEKAARSLSFTEKFELSEPLPPSEVVIPGADGENRVIEAQANFISHGDQGRAMLVVARDITDRRRIEQALKKSEEEFRLLIQHALDIITVLELDGTMRFQSPAVRHVLGYEVEDLVGKNAFAYIHPDDLASVLTVFMDALSIPGATRRVEYRFLHADGSWRYLETLGTNLTHDPHVAGVVVNSRDVTERRQAEQALQEANDTLETRVQERTAEIVEVMGKLEEAHLQQQQFVANASHDLRTPLTVIRTELDLFGSGRTIDRYTANTIDRVAGEVRILERLADDLLLLATLDQHDPVVYHQHVRLDELLLECVARLTKISREKDVLWDIQIEDPVEIYCDSNSLDRAITNVLDNAIKYSREGGTVVLTLAARSRTAGITVVDQGPGISEHDLPSIFDRFYRGDHARNTPGTGLGLAIARGIIDSHGGSISITSVPGEGTTATIGLPVAPTTNQEAEERSGTAAR